MWKTVEAAIAKGWALFFLSGAFFTFLAFYRFTGNLPTPTVASGPVQLPLLVLGIALLALAAFTFLAERDLLWSGPRLGIIKQSNMVKGTYRNCSISICFGKLEEKANACPGRCAVALPINNHFEARCFEDRKIALGSYLDANFSATEIGLIRQTVSTKLAAGFGDATPPYPVGTSVYLEHAGQRMILAAVSTKQAPEGVKSEIAFLHAAMHQIVARIVEEEINILYLPLIGSGKGGIPHQVALLSLLNGICESVNRASGHHLREAHIVILKQEKGLNPRSAHRLLQASLSLWADQP
jgi:hypothetical protein